MKILFKKNKYIIILILAMLILVKTNQVGQNITTSGEKIKSQSLLTAFEGDYETSSNIVETIVASIHGLDINENDPQTILPGQKAYFAKTLYNVGNVSENVSITLSPSTLGWSTTLIQDSNNDGIHQDGETTTVSPTLTLPPASPYRFFVVMNSPNTFNITGTVNLTVSASVHSIGIYTGVNLITYGGPAIVSAVNTASTSLQPAAPGGPIITDIKFDGVPVVNRDYIGKTPFITAKILHEIDIATSSIKITIDGISTTSGINFDGTYISYKVTTPLGKGSHVFIIEAQDVSGNISTKELTGRITEKPMIVGRVLPHPSPFNPLEDDVKITYQLTTDTSIRIYVHNIVGERIWQTKIDPGEEGGHAGYNEVLWGGTDGFSDLVGNGVYIVHIVDSKGRILAKTKILVIR